MCKILPNLKRMCNTYNTVTILRLEIYFNVDDDVQFII